MIRKLITHLKNLFIVRYRYTIPDTEITVEFTFGRFTNRAHIEYTMPAYIQRIEKQRLNPIHTFIASCN